MTKLVLFISNSSEFFYSHRLNLAKKLNDQGYKVILATPSSKSKKPEDTEWLEEENFFLKRNSRNLFYELLTLFTIFRLVYVLKPLFVHSLTIKPNIYVSIVSKFLNFKHVLATTGMGYLSTPKTLLEKCISQMVNSFLKLIYSKNFFYIFQNDDDLRKIQNIVKGDIIYIETFGSGVDLNQFTPSQSLRKDKKINIAFAGRLLIDKGINLFLNLAKEFQTNCNCIFHIFGQPDQGNPRSVSMDEIDIYNSFPNIRYHGFTKDLALHFQNMDIFVYPSYYGEGLPKVLLEASASSLALITSNIPGCLKVNRDGVTGFVINEQSLSAYVSALEKICFDGDLLQEFKYQSRLRAEKYFSEHEVILEHLKLYEIALESTSN